MPRDTVIGVCEALNAEHQALGGKPLDCSDVAGVLHSLRKEERAALCLSGGGIRSATFALGVLQGLSHYGLLKKFDYLSTVSGGGYIGSWLSAWLTRHSIEEVERDLAKKRDRAIDGETPEVAHLRSYSNYLSPQLGILSADTWTLASIILRNIFLNWLILVPLMAAVLLVPKLVYLFTVAVPYNAPGAVGNPPPYFGYAGWALLIVGGVLAVWAVRNIHRYLPSQRTANAASATQGSYLRSCLLPTCTSALGIAGFWALATTQGVAPATLWHFVGFGAAVHVLGVWNMSASIKMGRFPSIAFAALTGGVGGWLAWLAIDNFLHPVFNPRLYVLLAPVVVMTIYFVLVSLFLGFVSRVETEDDREWWARSGAWMLIVVTGWALLSALVLYAGDLLSGLQAALLGGGGGAIGGLGSYLGLSSSTSSGRRPDKPAADDSPGMVQKLRDALIAAAPLIFLICILSAVACGSDWLAKWLGGKISANVAVFASPDGQHWAEFIAADFWWAVFAAASLFMSRYIDVNTFSLHAMYRNRLIRAYLAASRPEAERDADYDRFTGFSAKDDVPLHKLSTGRPLHIINMALNLVRGEKLSWQQRKAESFTASRLHCGSMRLGYQSSPTYGGGLSLGTAVAISGAAASPNMGYHSSALVTFLMTLFNARLGWWLANPALPGRKHWNEEGPGNALRPIVDEALGLTDDRSKYIYLSDGGHFENLGLYEMVLRRCRFIVVVDASADPEYNFEDVANAIRKIRVDLGVSVRFQKPLSIGKKCEHNLHCAIAEIDYDCADPYAKDDPLPTGTLLYLKPSLNEAQSVDIDHYHAASGDFPQQSTAQQFFNEAQFESYRRLGVETVQEIFGGDAASTKDLAAFQLAVAQTIGGVVTKPLAFRAGC